MYLLNFFKMYGETLSTAALIITLGILIWYTWETRKLRIETVKQTELSLRPCVVLFGNDEVGSNYIENIGNGAALNVIIEPLETDKFKVVFEPYDLIKAGQRFSDPDYPKYDIKASSHEGEALINKMNLGSDYLDFPFMLRSKDYLLIVRYKNTEGTNYYTKLLVKAKEAKIEVLETGQAKKRYS
jgi:hypothetical protein